MTRPGGEERDRSSGDDGEEREEREEAAAGGAGAGPHDSASGLARGVRRVGLGLDTGPRLVSGFRRLRRVVGIVGHRRFASSFHR
jgi:hypothetical protein